MDEQKRFFLFIVLSTLCVLLTSELLRRLHPPRPRRPAAPQAQPAAERQQPGKQPATETGTAPAPASAATRADGAQPAAPPQPAIQQATEPPPARWTLGSTDPASGFKMQVTVTNRGAAIERILLADFDADDHSGPLKLVSVPTGQPGSFLLAVAGASRRLDQLNWELVEQHADDPDQPSITLRAALPEQDLTVSRTYRLRRGSYRILMDVEIRNRSQDTREVRYRLDGPHGSVLEGEWYSFKLRDAAIGGGTRTNVSRETVTAATLVKAADRLAKRYGPVLQSQGFINRDQWQQGTELFEEFDADGDGRLGPTEFRAALPKAAGAKHKWATEPLRFAGVEGQYFCTFLVLPPAADNNQRWDRATYPVLLARHPRRPKSSDVTVQIDTRPFQIAPGEYIRHGYIIYAGPRKKEVFLAELGDPALERALMHYPGFLIIPSSLINLTAGLMLACLKLFYGLVHNWGMAIILLTVLVRALMFPMSRKQALSAQKMQALKPELDALREKYKNDKEKLARAQMELWRKHGVSPFGGCLPVLVQMPIFIGLWRGLSGSVDLRHAPFVLWIDNLAAPDALFWWGEHIPIISWALGPYFNLLPTVLIVLMMVQQKLFMPPATDPQTQAQQKMMTWIMVFFGFIFYRLPSGLCLYYAASTLWGIAERKLLPKLQTAEPAAAAEQPERPTSPAAKVLKRLAKAPRPSKPAGRPSAQAGGLLQKLTPTKDGRRRQQQTVAGRGHRRRRQKTPDKPKSVWVERLQELIKKAGKP